MVTMRSVDGQNERKNYLFPRASSVRLVFKFGSLLFVGKGSQ